MKVFYLRACLCLKNRKQILQKRIVYTLVFTVLSCVGARAQERPRGALHLTGTVTSAETGHPLRGANIKVANRGGALPKTPDTQTDAEGKFNLYTSLTEGAIQVSYVGYVIQAIHFTPVTTSPFTIRMEREGASPEPTLQIPVGGLRIGDSIPEAIWQLPLPVVNHPEGKDTITLNDYRDQLIILDFWATYCKPCIASLAKLDTVQREAGSDGFVVLPVQVYDQPAKAAAFFEKMGWTWPTVVHNDVLNKQLLARYLTGFGMAWLRDGRLLAVPQGKYVTKENIMKAAGGEQPVLENRKAQYEH